MGGRGEAIGHATRLTAGTGESNVIRSEKRILTTHAGALPRPAELREMIFARADGKPYDEAALAASLRQKIGRAHV